jgi:hypothetical protein
MASYLTKLNVSEEMRQRQLFTDSHLSHRYANAVPPDVRCISPAHGATAAGRGMRAVSAATASARPDWTVAWLPHLDLSPSTSQRKQGNAGAWSPIPHFLWLLRAPFRYPTERRWCRGRRCTHASLPFPRYIRVGVDHELTTPLPLPLLLLL